MELNGYTEASVPGGRGQSVGPHSSPRPRASRWYRRSPWPGESIPCVETTVESWGRRFCSPGVEHALGTQRRRLRSFPRRTGRRWVRPQGGSQPGHKGCLEGVSAELGLPGKAFTCNAGCPGSIPGLGKIPWRRERLPTPVFWPGESHGQRSLGGHGVAESQTWLSEWA